MPLPSDDDASGNEDVLGHTRSPLSLRANFLPWGSAPVAGSGHKNAPSRAPAQLPQRLSSIAPKCFQQETDLRGISCGFFLCCFSPTASRVFPNSHGFPSRVAGLSCVGERFVFRFRISRRKCQFDPGMAMAKGAEARKMPVGARFGRNATWWPLWQPPAYQSGSNWHFLTERARTKG